MKIRFQADADLNQIIVKAVLRREPAIDFKTAHTANLSALDDIEVLGFAAKEGRVLVTHDHKTMPKLFADFIMAETSSGVLIISQKLPVARAAEELILIWIASEAEEWINKVRFLPL